MFVPDPFIYFEIGGKKHIVMSDLDVDAQKRMRRSIEFSRWRATSAAGWTRCWGSFSGSFV